MFVIRLHRVVGGRHKTAGWNERTVCIPLHPHPPIAVVVMIVADPPDDIIVQRVRHREFSGALRAHGSHQCQAKPFVIS